MGLHLDGMKHTETHGGGSTGKNSGPTGRNRDATRCPTVVGVLVEFRVESRPAGVVTRPPLPTIFLLCPLLANRIQRRERKFQSDKYEPALCRRLSDSIIAGGAWRVRERQRDKAAAGSITNLMSFSVGRAPRRPSSAFLRSVANFTLARDYNKVLE